MRPRSPVATEVTSIFSDLEEVAGRVRRDADRMASGSADATVVPAASGQLSDSARVARGEALRHGARGLEKLALDPGADLSPAERFGVEAIVLQEGRPALFVEHGDFPSDLPPEWAGLEHHRSRIQESIARVGRVEVAGHPDYDWVGTGFLVAPDVVMTNRHVAVEFARRDVTSWSFMSGRTAAWDLFEERRSTPRTGAPPVPEELEFDVVEVLAVHDADDIDLALLRVEPAEQAGDLPSPVPLASAAPPDLFERQVYVVGYPAWDGRRNEPEDMKRIFEDVYNVKRLQPGQITASADPDLLLRHDCSTLGGNSGSPVFDLDSHQVVGLHFGGRYLVGNQAVPMWRLVDDPLVKPLGLQFC